MNPYTQTSVALLMFTINLYWIAALFTIFLRAKEPHFQQLTQYSGRLAPAASYSSNNEKDEKKTRRAVVDVPDQGRARASLPAVHVQRMKASAKSIRHIVSIVGWVRSSVLGRMWIGRRDSFCIFYLSGILTCACIWGVILTRFTPFSLTKSNMPALLRVETCLPLLAFSIHILVRLAECLILQEFRDQKEDRMLLFATLAGSSFYIFAPLSSNGALIYSISFWGCGAPSGGTSEDVSIGASFDCSIADSFQSYNLSRSVRLLMWLLFTTHILVQLLQVLHHRILSELRRSSPTLSGEDLPPIIFSAVKLLSMFGSNSFSRNRKGGFRENEDETDSRLQLIFEGWRGSNGNNFGAKASRTSGRPGLLTGGGMPDRRVWTYRFPQRLLFSYIQEPHYSCEIVMYAINLIAMLVLFLSLFPRHVSLNPSGKSVHTPTVPLGPSTSFFLAERIAWMQVSAAFLVGLFTLCNLAITSSEHQRFWWYLNSIRREVRWAINQPHVAKQQAASQDRLGSGEACETIRKLTQHEPVPKWRLFPFIY